MESAQIHQEVSDAELLALTRLGDREAFTRLVERHQDAMVSYLTRLCSNRERAEDLAQEVFVRLFLNAGSYREQGHLRAYLYRIATNLVRSEFRRERRWRVLRPLFFVAGEAHAEATQPRNVLRRELGRRLESALARLPLHYRAPLVLHEIEGLGYGEIAGSLGCREGTVKSRIHRARKMLRLELAGYVEEGLP